MAQRLGSSGAAILVPELTSRCKLTKPFCACCSSFDFVESMSRLVFSELQASSAFQETEKEQAADVTSIGVGHHFTVLSYVNAFWTNSHIRKQTAHIAIFTTSLIHRIVTCKNLLSRQLITLLFSPVTRHHDGRIHKDMLTTTIYVAGGSLNEKRLPRLIRMNLAVSRGPRKKERTISHLTPQFLSVKIPRTWDLAKFAIPTLGIWLSNPILSVRCTLLNANFQTWSWSHLFERVISICVMFDCLQFACVLPAVFSYILWQSITSGCIVWFRFVPRPLYAHVFARAHLPKANPIIRPDRHTSIFSEMWSCWKAYKKSVRPFLA